MRKISFLTLLMLAVTFIGYADAQPIGILTTPPGSFTHSASSVIAKIMVEKAGLKTTVQPAATRAYGAIDSGLAEFSMASSSDLALAAAGVDEYQDQGPKKNLRMVATLMPMWGALHVRKDSTIKSVKDLKGKRVSSGFHAQKTIARHIEAVLANAGLTYDDVKQVPSPNAARGAEDFGNGKTDVLYFAVGSAAVMEIASKVGGLRVLPLDDSSEAVARMQKVVPVAYVTEVMPGPNMEGVTEPTKVYAFDSVLFAHVKVADDIIYKVVKVIYESKTDLVAGFAGFRIFSPQRMAVPVHGVDFHPGAIKFYKETGLLPAKN